MHNIKKDSFVAVSDFHSYEWPLEKIKKYYLYEYDKIFILGDAIDRGEKQDGTGGISLLQEIKKLCDEYPGRVIYIPGNHDDFLYRYAKYNDSDAKNSLMYNHGSKTVADIDNLKIHNRIEFKKLIDWLETQPLQREHFYDGQRYVFAHALFNEDLFKKNEFFSLKDYRKFFMESDYYYNILWFRKIDSDYDNSLLPNGDTIMVIGHTPNKYREDVDLDLENSHGENVRVYCVDGGIAYHGTMQKYFGGSFVVDTNRYSHKVPEDTSENTKVENKETNVSHNSIEEFVNMTFISYLKKYDTFERAMLEFLSTSFNEDNNTSIINYDTNEEVSKAEVRAYLKEVLISYISRGKSNKDIHSGIIDIYRLFFTKVSFDFITKCQFEKFGTLDRVISQQEGFEREKDFFYITNSVGNARDIVQKVGFKNLNNFLYESEYTSFSDYIKNEFGKRYKK